MNDRERTPFPTEISNGKRTTHVNIPGTRVFLVPPKGFTASSKFNGIQKNNFTVIEVRDMRGLNFYTNTALFSEAELQKAGYRVLQFKELTVNGFAAKIALLKGYGATRNYTFVFGDSTFTASINGFFTAGDNEAAEQVRQGLISVYYDTAMKISRYPPPIFTLNDEKSIFKYAKSDDGQQFYTLKGKARHHDNTEPYVVAVNVAAAGLPLDKVADKLVLIPGNYNIGNIAEGMVNGFPSISRELLGEMDGREVIIYQHAVLIDETVVCMQGVADDPDFDKYLEEFKKLTSTVGRKSKGALPVKKRIPKNETPVQK